MLQEFTEYEAEVLISNGYLINADDGMAKRSSYDGLWDKIYKEDAQLVHVGKERVGNEKVEFRRVLSSIEDINNG